MKSNSSGGRKAAAFDRDRQPQQHQQQAGPSHPSNIRVDPEAVPTTSDISAVTLPSVSGSAVSLHDDSKEYSMGGGDVEQGRRRRSAEKNAAAAAAAAAAEAAHPHLHGQALHDEAMIAAASERSTMTIPSAATTPERVDDEGQSLLHRGVSGSGGSGGSGGRVYQSFGTMEDVSGASSFVLDHDGGTTDFPSPSSERKDENGDEDDAAAAAAAVLGLDTSNNNVQDHNLFAVGVDAERAESSSHHSQQQSEKSHKRKKVGFSLSPSAIADDEMKSLQGQQQQRQQPRRTSRALSIFGSIFGASNHGDTDGDGMDEEGLLGAVQEEESGEEPPPRRRRGWSVIRNREKSIILYGQRLVSLDDSDEDDADNDDDDDNDRDMKSEASEANGDSSISERSAKKRDSLRRARLKEKLLERASATQQTFNISVKECTAAIVAYLALSVLAYSFVFENWPMVDSLYFGVVTFTSVGYGDLVPSTDAGRLFCIIYALGGCAALGIALGVLGDTMIQSQLSTLKKLKLNRQRKVMSSIEKEREISASQRTQGEEKSRPRLHFVIVRIPIFLAIALCSAFISLREGWYWTNGVYYTIVTMCTIGYGDYAPEHHHSRALAVIFIPCSVAVLGALLSRIASAVINKRQAQFRDEMISFNLTPDMFECMDSSEDGHVTKAEYISFMLLAMKAVDKELLDALNQQFERLDETNTGDLTIDDLKASLEKSLRSVKTKLELSKYKREMLSKGGSDKSMMTESIRFGSRSPT